MGEKVEKTRNFGPFGRIFRGPHLAGLPPFGAAQIVQPLIHKFGPKLDWPNMDWPNGLRSRPHTSSPQCS